jgi:hypothetical protein
MPPETLSRAAATYEISGGLIRNAAARLNVGPLERPVTWAETQEAVSSQLHGSIEWRRPEIRFRDARLMLDAASRRTLLRIADLWNANALLAHENGRSSGKGFKILLKGDALAQNCALPYLERRLRRKAHCVGTDDLIPKDSQKQSVTPLDLGRSVEACSLTKGLPVLFMYPCERDNEKTASKLASAFAGAGGFGVLCLLTRKSPPEDFHPSNLGPWITVHTKVRNRLGLVTVGPTQYQLLVTDHALKSKLLELRFSQLALLSRWALARQRREKPATAPGVILEPFLRTALELLEKPDDRQPIF